MTTFQQRTRAARLVLLLAFGLLLLSQVMPLEGSGSVPTYAIWVILGTLAWQSLHSGTIGSGLLPLFAYGFLFLFIAAGPFIVTFLTKARPLLWVARLMVVGLVGFFLKEDLLYQLAREPQTGGNFIVYAVFLQIPGLLLIPGRTPLEDPSRSRNEN